MKTILSYILAFATTCLILAPGIGFNVPIIINSFHWLYMIVTACFLGMLSLHYKISLWLKVLIVYLFATCFVSEFPSVSFTAYVLIVVALWAYIGFKNADFNVIIKFLESVFWVQFILTMFQSMGMDNLINFDKTIPVFLGTVMNYMRYASLLAIMAPFLLLKNKWYIIPIFILCVLSQSTGFALSLVVGVASYLFLVSDKKFRHMIVLSSFCFLALYANYDWASIRGAVIPSNGGRLVSWWAVLQTWVIDTSGMPHPSPDLVGPFQWKWLLFGHGLDTFRPLFPVYKHDPNPFPIAHNSFLQWAWETGSVGFVLLGGYFISLGKRLLKYREHMLFAGLLMVFVQLFFAFPDRQTQTMLLLVAYFALCDRKISLKFLS